MKPVRLAVCWRAQAFAQCSGALTVAGIIETRARCGQHVAACDVLTSEGSVRFELKYALVAGVER